VVRHEWSNGLAEPCSTLNPFSSLSLLSDSDVKFSHKLNSRLVAVALWQQTVWLMIQNGHLRCGYLGVNTMQISGELRTPCNCFPHTLSHRPVSPRGRCRTILSTKHLVLCYADHTLSSLTLSYLRYGLLVQAHNMTLRLHARRHQHQL
jgi:hypothetical protein